MNTTKNQAEAAPAKVGSTIGICDQCHGKYQGRNWTNFGDSRFDGLCLPCCEKKAAKDQSTAQSGQHTPGPWKIIGRPQGSRRIEIRIDRIPSYYGDGPNYAEVRGDNADANARLIAAAPELLQSLIRLTEWDQYCEANADCGKTESELREDALEAARAAIAKARGES